MKKETIQIADRTCTIYKSEHPEYLLIQPIDEHDLELLDNEVAVIQSQTNKPFTLVAFEIKDWQSELTPWTAAAVFGRVPFGDGAVATLSFIKDIFIPHLQQIQLFDKNKMKCVLGAATLWQASLPYGQVIRQRSLMVLQPYHHLSGTLNGWSMQRTTNPWRLPFISASVIKKKRRRTP